MKVTSSFRRRWRLPSDQFHGDAWPRLICLALTKDRVEQLVWIDEPQTTVRRHETAVHCLDRSESGVTTGISAADRARTISVAIDASKGAEHIVTPGTSSRFARGPAACSSAPAIPRRAVDVARLAGLNPSGVICEIMNEDGSMARFTAS